MRSKKPKDLVMVLTGASSGIGRATALQFARNGRKVVLAARNMDALETIAKECVKQGGLALVVQTDVSKEEEVRLLAEEAIHRFGRIDVWVNNAAVIAFGGFEQTPPEDFRQVLEVNLFGYTYGAREALKQFRKQGYGTLINVGSIAGVVGQPFAIPYSISKFGIHGLSAALAQELATEKHIHVCTVLPSTVDTPIYQQGANFTGRRIAPPVSVIPAHKVAKAIIKLSHKPQKRVFVGNLTTLMRLSRFLLPSFFDQISYYLTIGLEFKDEKLPHTKGNLYKPDREKAAVGGGWMEQKKQKNNKITAVAAGTGLLIGLGLLLKKS